MFNAKEQIELCKKEMVRWFKYGSKGAKGVVVGISGGKDSTVVAALWVEAIGAENVFGVLMPNGNQSDIKDSIEVCEALSIEYMTVNIQDAFNGVINSIRYNGGRIFALSSHTQTNIPPRIRMTTLYAIAQELGYRVSGTGNASEAYIGYCTKWGDAACDFNPVADFTTDEVVAIGDALGIPTHLTHKTPSDGLCGKSDEDNLGFTYQTLNRFLETGVCDDHKIEGKIKSMHTISRHKFEPIPIYTQK